MHAGDGLHHPAVTQPETIAINGLHATDVRRAVLRERNRAIARDGARHARCPQQFVFQMPIDELMQIEQVLEQLPALRERRRHELDERFGKISRDVIVGQRRPERTRMRAPREIAFRRHPQRLFLHTLAPTLQHLRLAGVDEGGEASFEDAIDACASHARYQRMRPVSTSRSMVKSPRRLYSG